MNAIPSSYRDALAGLADMIDGAIETHIYDLDNGDVIEPDCGYTKAVADTRKLLQDTEALQPSDDAKTMIRSLIGAVQALEEQVSQMRGMFNDEDGTIQQAVDDADETTGRANAFLAATAGKPVRVLVVIEGGAVQEVGAEARMTGVEIVVIDYDIDSMLNYEPGDVTFVSQGEGEDPEAALVATHQLSGDPVVIAEMFDGAEERFAEHFA